MNEQVRHRAVQPLKVNRARSPERVLTCSEAPRVLQAAQLHLRLQEAVLLPGRADEGHAGLASKWILEPASLSQKVTNAPMSFVKARATVTLCSATPFGTLDCCVCTVGS